jgi:hypothetical protein
MAARSKKASARRGRSIVALALLGFVLVMASVIWRRAAGASRARELNDLIGKAEQLQSQREALLGEIADARSRRRIAPIVEQKLGMRVPNDSQIVDLPPVRHPQPSSPASSKP